MGGFVTLVMSDLNRKEGNGRQRSTQSELVLLVLRLLLLSPNSPLLFALELII